VREIEIRDEAIRLGQLLKLAGIADAGSDARILLEAGDVRVNGELETRRGRQLRPGDVVSTPGDAVRVSSRPWGTEPASKDLWKW
jgi:ribosome-associated protein